MKITTYSLCASFLASMYCASPVSQAANIAPEGAGIIGVHDGVDGQEGSIYEHAGSAANINDADPATRVDTWGAGTPLPGMDFSYVGIIWPNVRGDAVSRLRLTLATFSSGGWFGPPGLSPGEGGVLVVEPVNYLTQPAVQVTTDGGISWVTVQVSSNYASSMTGHGIGGGNNPYASWRTVTFVLDEARSGIDGVRIIGENGGDGDNGFLGVFELEVESLTADTDSDGMDDAWEIQHGLTVGADDAGMDGDGDGLTNRQEFVSETNPGNPDTDGDGLSDGAEVNTHKTDPGFADSDGDGLSDGAEVSIHLTNPRLTDTDRDSLNDWQEIYVHQTNPLLIDTDNDGFTDSMEVRMSSNPLLAESIPANLAPAGTAILGTSTHLHPSAVGGGEVYIETPHANSGIPANINDGLLSTQVNTWGRTDPYAYAGVVWPASRPQTIDRLELTLAIYFDGGWFGPGDRTPGSNSQLSHDANNPDANYLLEPVVQVTTDGQTWTAIETVSNYLKIGHGHPTPAGDYWAPTAVTAVIELASPQTNLRGIRVIGSEGGTASGGFLGVWEFAAMDASKAFPNLSRYGSPIMGVSAEVDDQPGTRYSQIETGPLPNINDGDIASRSDNWNGNNPGTASFVGIIWPESREELIDRLEVTFAIFSSGGWFGPNNVVPGANETLSAANSLVEPVVQVTTNGGRAWTTVAHTSTYLPGLEGQLVPGPEGLQSATVIFAMGTPVADIDGIRLIGVEGGNASGGFLGIFEFQVKDVTTLGEANQARYATGLIGTNDAIDDDNGRQYPHAGLSQYINDGVSGSRVDTWDGGEGSDTISYAALLWPRPTTIQRLNLTMAAFSTGGWFGTPDLDPGPGGALTPAAHLREPTIQVTADGSAWMDVDHTSDYLPALDGHGIGGGGNPDPSVASAVFNLSAAQSGIRGIRLIGESGGTASGGFLGVFEMEAYSPPVLGNEDTDGDGQSDALEGVAGTDPNDARSFLRVVSVAPQGDGMVVEWSSVPGKTYRIQSSETLALMGWNSLGERIPAAAAPGTTTQATVPFNSPVPGFWHYRVIVEP